MFDVITCETEPVSPAAATPAAKLLQSCLTLCDPRDGSPPGSPVLHNLLEFAQTPDH